MCNPPKLLWKHTTARCVCVPMLAIFTNSSLSQTNTSFILLSYHMYICFLTTRRFECIHSISIYGINHWALHLILMHWIYAYLTIILFLRSFWSWGFFPKKKKNLNYRRNYTEAKKKSETKSQHNRPKHSIRVNPLITPSVGRESVGFM